MTAKRITSAMECLENLIGQREDGVRYLPLLRRLRAELATRDDDEAELARLRQRTTRRAA